MSKSKCNQFIENYEQNYNDAMIMLEILQDKFDEIKDSKYFDFVDMIKEKLEAMNDQIVSLTLILNDTIPG